MTLFYVLFVIAGVIFLAFQLFVNQGGKAKFKSDLPKTEEVKKGERVKRSIILCLGCLAALFLLLTLLSRIL